MLDEIKVANFITGSISDVVESFDPIEESTITLSNINSEAKNSEIFKRYALVPNSYKSVSKIQCYLTGYFQNHFVLQLSDDLHERCALLL